MAVHHGKNGKVKLGVNLVAAVTKFSVTETVGDSDTTAMGDTAQTHIVGIPGWSGKIEGNYDPANTTGQVALTIGASVSIGLYTDGDASGKKYLSGTASVVNVDREASYTDRATFSIDIKGNGALTHCDGAVMSEILERARAHYQAKPRLTIEIPEWGTPGSPCIITWTALTVHEQDRIYEPENGRTPRGGTIRVRAVMLKACDASGRRLFDEMAEHDLRLRRRRRYRRPHRQCDPLRAGRPERPQPGRPKSRSKTQKTAEGGAAAHADAWPRPPPWQDRPGNRSHPLPGIHRLGRVLRTDAGQLSESLCDDRRPPVGTLHPSARTLIRLSATPHPTSLRSATFSHGEKGNPLPPPRHSQAAEISPSRRGNAPPSPLVGEGGRAERGRMRGAGAGRRDRSNH